MLTLAIQADLVVQSDDGDIVALVEVKNQQQLTPEIAAAYRRNLDDHGALKPWAPFFLLVSQEVGFLWDQRGSTSPETPPSVEFPMAPIVRRYLPWLADGEWLRKPELISAVTRWLSDLAEGCDDLVSAEVLAQIGLLDMIKDGWVASDIDR